MMVIPNKIQIAGKVYSIKYVDIVDEINDSGQVDYKKSEILLRNRDIDEQTIRESFWHEIVHCILMAMGDFSDHDEKFVEGFAQYLNQISQQITKKDKT